MIRLDAIELRYRSSGNFCNHPGTKVGTPPEGAIKLSSTIDKREDGREIEISAYACGLRKFGLTTAQKRQIENAKDGCTGCPKLPNQE